MTGPAGERDPQQAYVPHGYDIVVDTPALASASSARVELIFRRHGETAKRLAMPMIIGEWVHFGAAGAGSSAVRRVLQRQFERLLCGDTYWDFGREIQERAYFVTLKRSIPSRTAGCLPVKQTTWPSLADI